MQELADLIITDEDLPEGPEAEQAQKLMVGGTSMGGARPKAMMRE